MISEILLLLYVFLVPGDGLEVFLDQPHDFRTDKLLFLAYETRGSNQYVADDFRPAGPVIVESVTFWMPATPDPPPSTWSFNVFRTTDDHPRFPYAPEFWFFYRMRIPSQVIDHGFWATQIDDIGNEHTYNLYEVRFDNVGLRLDPGGWLDGMFWFGPVGFIDRPGVDRSGWGTANNGVKNGDQAWWKPDPNTWRPTGLGRDTDPSDYAMRIEGYRVGDAPEPETVVTTFEVVTGELLDGETDDIRRTDDQRVTVRSSFREINEHRMEMIVHAQTKTKNADLMDITIEQHLSDGARAPALHSLFNWRTGEYDLIKEYTVSWTNFVYAIRDIPPADYVNEDGEIRLWIDIRDRALNLWGWRFEYFLNRVRFDLRAED